MRADLLAVAAQDVEARLSGASFSGAVAPSSSVQRLEENVRAGGFGEAVLDLLADNGLAERYLGCLSMPDEIVDHGPQPTMRQLHEVDGPGIAARATEALRQRSTLPFDRDAALAPA